MSARKQLSAALAGALLLTWSAAPTGAQSSEPPAPNRSPGTTGSAAPLTPEEQEVLSEVEEVFERFRAAAERHDERMRTVLLRQYERRRNEVDARYKDRIGTAEDLERKNRQDAIALLERFIKRYPKHRQFTPDAMFRLADLYLDRSNEEFEKAFDEGALLAGGELDEEAELTADYSPSIALWNRIINEFPQYRQRAGTLYLLAYYMKQTGREREALQVARGLVCANRYDPVATPEPAPTREAVRQALATGEKLVSGNPYEECQSVGEEKALLQDAWVRIIGDIHFLTPGELPYAISAYASVAGDDKSEFYDEALYKLAWSYYRNDDFLDGIRAFDESIVYSDKLVAQGQDPLELRPEALQYIAISFTDPWTRDEQIDPVKAFERAWTFYKDRLNEPHVRDVFVELGNTFEILEAYDQAVDSWKLALKNWPLHPENPLIHQKVVSAFASKGDRDLADEEAARMAERYAAGSEWYEANQTDRAAMDLQARLGERLLRAAALNMHRSAQQARQEHSENPTPESKERYVKIYRRAASLYQRFVTEYPTANEVYEFTYFLGDTLFWAEDYMAAIEHYRWVRDHRDLSTTRFEKAALSIVQSYEREVARRVASGQLTEPPSPTLDDLKAMPQPIRAQNMPSLYRDWQQALDQYQTLVNDPKTAPDMGYLAGLISYRFLDLNDAAKRFETTFRKFCGQENAVKAKDALLAIYEATNRDDLFRATNERFIQQRCGSDADIQLARAQNRSKKFREAEDLARDRRYDDAALAFYQYYKASPGDDPNQPVALYNAALNYNEAGKPKTAVYLYREFTENREPAFRTSEYYLTALYLTAVSYNNAFDYDNAVKSYLEVVKLAEQPGRKNPAGIDLDLEQIRLTSLYNAAVLRELDRVYKDPRGAPKTGAVSLYRRYARESKERAEKERALWAIARIYRTAGDLRNLPRAYTDWRQAHGRTAGNEDKYIFSYYNLAKLYAKRGQQRNAGKMKRETLKAWETVGRPKGSAGADMAAEFAFEDAERFRKSKFDPFKITRAPKTEKEAKKILDRLDATSNNARKQYRALSKYESGTYGLAALVRIGDTFFFQGLKLKDAPVPKEIERLDARYPDKDILLQYQDAIDKVAQPLIDQAAKQWEKVVTAGRQQGVANEWTQLAQERLHDFIDQQAYPVLRQELIGGTEDP